MEVDQELYVLHPRLVVTDVRDLPNEVRSALGDDTAAVAVSLRGVRAPSMALCADTARLLDRFKTPTTLARAICDYAAEVGSNPHEIVDEAAHIFTRLQSAGILVTPRVAAKWGPAEPSFIAGQQIGTWRVVQCLQAYADSEVYCVISAQDVRGALKIEGLHASGSDRERLRAESEILGALRTPCVPVLLENVMVDDRFGLVLHWVEGGRSDRVASELRMTHQAAAVRRLAVDISATYAKLHSQGYLQGDVNPANILVGKNGTVHLVDFGGALRLLDQTGPGAYGRRAAVSQYLEPEAIADRLAGKVKLPTELGEQYAVAAILYLLLTGSFHVPRLIDPKTWYGLVSGRTATPSGSLDLQPDLENVLRRALAVEPTQRYPSMATFAKDLRSVIECAGSEIGRNSYSFAPFFLRNSAPTRMPVRNVLHEFSGCYIDAYLRFREHTPTLPDNAPANSIYHGGAGVTLACLRLAFLRGDAELLATADLLATRSTKAFAIEERQWSNGINLRTVDRVSLFHAGPGIHLAAVLAAECMGDATGRRNAVQAFISESMGKWRSPDLTMGRAGALLGALVLLRSLNSDAVSERTKLLKAAEMVYGELEALLVSLGPIGQDDRLDFLGVAHGWAGVLLAILEWCNETQRVAPDSIEGRLQELANLRVTTGAGIAWRRRGNGGTDLLAGWCHGSAGYVSLWLSAWRLYRKPEYLVLALHSGLETYKSEAFPISDVCCGYAGRSWSLLEIARATGENVWVDRARELGMRAIELKQRDDRPQSLFKGTLGVALLAAELEDPGYAAFPLGRDWWV
jgi:serine/threonine protein kinase